MNVYALTNSKGKAVANQYIVDTGNAKVFKSYDTDIASVSRASEVVLTDSWDYSATTTKYLCQFLSQEAGFGPVNKAIILKLMKSGKIKLTDKDELC